MPSTWSQGNPIVPIDHELEITLRRMDQQSIQEILEQAKSRMLVEE